MSLGLKCSEALGLLKSSGQRADCPAMHLLIICCTVMPALWQHVTNQETHTLIISTSSEEGPGLSSGP